MARRIRCSSAARRASVNAGIPLPDVVTSTSTALAETDFTAAPLGGDPGFGGPRTGFAHQGPAFGELEAQPHGPIHVMVGGNTGLMTDPDTAAIGPDLLAAPREHRPAVGGLEHRRRRQPDAQDLADPVLPAAELDRQGGPDEAAGRARHRRPVGLHL